MFILTDHYCIFNSIWDATAKENLCVGKAGKHDLRIYQEAGSPAGLGSKPEMRAWFRKGGSAEPLGAGSGSRGAVMLVAPPASQAQHQHPLLPAEAKTPTNAQFSSRCGDCWQNQGVRPLMACKQPCMTSFFESII